MVTTTEKYIKKAVLAAKDEFSSTTLSNVNIEMNMQADGATQILAQALLAQAEANEANSDAIRQLAEALKPIDVCAIKFQGNSPAEFGAVAD